MPRAQQKGMETYALWNCPRDDRPLHDDEKFNGTQQFYEEYEGAETLSRAARRELRGGTLFEEILFDEEVDKDERLYEKLCSDRSKELFLAEPADPSFAGDILRRPPVPRRFLATGPLRRSDRVASNDRRGRERRRRIDKQAAKKAKEEKRKDRKTRNGRGIDGDTITFQVDSDDITGTSGAERKELARKEEALRKNDEEETFQRGNSGAFDPSGNAFALQFDDETGIWHYQKVKTVLEDVDPCEITWRGTKMAVRAAVATDRRGALRLYATRGDGTGSFSLSEEALDKADRGERSTFGFVEERC